MTQDPKFLKNIHEKFPKDIVSVRINKHMLDYYKDTPISFIEMYSNTLLEFNINFRNTYIKRLEKILQRKSY